MGRTIAPFDFVFVDESFGNWQQTLDGIRKCKQSISLCCLHCSNSICFSCASILTFNERGRNCRWRSTLDPFNELLSSSECNCIGLNESWWILIANQTFHVTCHVHARTLSPGCHMLIYGLANGTNRRKHIVHILSFETIGTSTQRFCNGSPTHTVTHRIHATAFFASKMPSV